MMKVGAATCDITPTPGAQLSGYLFRVQPSVAVHDPLYLRALYLEHDEQRLLWMHADVIGVTNEFMIAFRAWARREMGLRAEHVVFSTTHTHAGPATVPLILCGDDDAVYIRRLHAAAEQTATRAMQRMEPAMPVTAEARCDLAVDRRRKASAHVDPRIGLIGFRRHDGSYVALLSNYAMHNVGLSFDNRQISADIAGAAAGMLGDRLSGGPAVIFTNGAAANVNPPAQSTDFAQIGSWAQALAEPILRALDDPQPLDGGLTMRMSRMKLALEPMDNQSIERIASRAADALPRVNTYQSQRYHDAVQIWRQRMLQALADRCIPESVEVELHLVRCGDVNLLCINAEIFSRFADDLRSATGQRLYVVGYANGLVGYVPPAEAIDEGGYEADSAFIFYGGLPLQRGGYERLRDEAVELVRSLKSAPPPPTAAAATT